MSSLNDPFAPDAAGSGQPPRSQEPYGQPPQGQPPYGPQYGAYTPYGAPVSQRQNGFGVTALVLGITSIIPGAFYAGVVLGPLAIIFAVLGRKRVKRQQADNGGMALAGLITGIIGLILAVGVTILAIAFFNDSSFRGYRDCLDHATTQQQRSDCAREFSQSFNGT